MIELIYFFQIVVLTGCIYMTYRARFALNGLTRGVILLLILLIVRRLDDAFGLLDSLAVAGLSTAVVVVITLDIYKLYKDRHVYATYLQHRRKNIEQLEKSKTWTD